MAGERQRQEPYRDNLEQQLVGQRLIILMLAVAMRNGIDRGHLNRETVQKDIESAMYGMHRSGYVAEVVRGSGTSRSIISIMDQALTETGQLLDRK